MWLSWPWLCSLHITETAALTWDWFHGSSFLMELAWGWSHDIIRDPEREREKTCQSPWHLDVKPTHHHFCHICWAKQVTGQPRLKGKGNGLHILMGEGAGFNCKGCGVRRSVISLWSTTNSPLCDLSCLAFLPLCNICPPVGGCSTAEQNPFTVEINLMRKLTVTILRWALQSPQTLFEFSCEDSLKSLIVSVELSPFSLNHIYNYFKPVRE